MENIRPFIFIWDNEIEYKGIVNQKMEAQFIQCIIGKHIKEKFKGIDNIDDKEKFFIIDEIRKDIVINEVKYIIEKTIFPQFPSEFKNKKYNNIQKLKIYTHLHNRYLPLIDWNCGHEYVSLGIYQFILPGYPDYISFNASVFNSQNRFTIFHEFIEQIECLLIEMDNNKSYLLMDAGGLEKFIDFLRDKYDFTIKYNFTIKDDKELEKILIEYLYYCNDSINMFIDYNKKENRFTYYENGYTGDANDIKI